MARLTRTYGDYIKEIIVVNDNSVDATAETARALGKRTHVSGSSIRSRPEA